MRRRRPFFTRRDEAAAEAVEGPGASLTTVDPSAAVSSGSVCSTAYKPDSAMPACLASYAKNARRSLKPALPAKSAILRIRSTPRKYCCSAACRSSRNSGRLLPNSRLPGSLIAFIWYPYVWRRDLRRRGGRWQQRRQLGRRVVGRGSDDSSCWPAGGWRGKTQAWRCQGQARAAPQLGLAGAWAADWL